MISERAIGLAVERAVITADQAEALRATEREIAPSAAEPVDDEKLRFVSGFADIFVGIGIVLFLGALAYIMDSGAGSTPMFAGLAACAWLLAEFFTFKRRMALPSILLLVIFVGSVLFLSLQVFGSLLPGWHQVPARFWFVPAPNAGALVAASIVTVAMAAMHYKRFHVPITIAAGALALCLLVFGLVAAALPTLSEAVVDIVFFVCGLGVFALAMRFDMSDPARETRRTDIAFWLHLLAAPLIVHPLLRAILHGLDGRLPTGAAVAVLWVFLALGAVAVVIDRRAILVSGLTYAGIAFGQLIGTWGFATSKLLVPTVVLALGAFILLVSAGWQPLRRAILRRLPVPLARRLPHPQVQSQT